MGNCSMKIFKKRRKEFKVLFLGLDGAGKTQLLYRLKLGGDVLTIPTTGFNVETLVHKNVKIRVWDIGGAAKIRLLQLHYYTGTDAVVMVIDSSDNERLDEFERDILRPAKNSSELTHCIFLFLVNKKDIPYTLSKDEVTAKLNLQSIKQTWYIIETSATRGDGLEDALDCLSSTLV